MIASAGSSPRMRGKPGRRQALVMAPRIIPAHAGQTAPFCLPAMLKSDHPRACGANPDKSGDFWLLFGSSPRMRGKRKQLLALCKSVRIIPAHAGQTVSRPRSQPGRADHPRACGANALKIKQAVIADGSSPRMRGKRCAGPMLRARPRIIPAHAGQTCDG